MISGVVNADLEAEVRLMVRGPAGRTKRIRAVIDAGYDGYLSLPPATVAELALPWSRTAKAILADGNEVDVDVFRGTVVWDRIRCAISVDEADTAPLVGTAMLEGFRFNSEFLPGGKVAIRALRSGRR
jgi:clan AA aspartic protease